MNSRKQFVNRNLPTSLLDLPGVERWLGEQAALGLIPVRGHARSFRFHREEPRPGRRYHLCPTAQTSPTPSREQLELFTQAGWDFLLDVSASLAHFYLFCTDDPAAPEPFTDPDSLLQALRYPVGDCLRSVVFALFLITVYVFLTALAYTFSLVFLVVTLLILVDGCEDLVTVLLLRRSLKGGAPLRPDALSRIHRRMKIVRSALSIAGLLCYLAAMAQLLTQ